jgi:Flp pilus assembly protein TadG
MTAAVGINPPGHHVRTAMTSIPDRLRTLPRRASRSWLPRRVRGFGGNQQASTAIEFGIVALPFFALIFAIIETALAFFAGQALETAVTTASRAIRTGAAQSAGLTASTFKASICSQLTYLFSCNAGLYVDVKTYASFAAISLGIPVDANGNLMTVGYTYNAGHGGDIVVVRAYYEWPVFVNQLGNNLATQPDGTHLLTATSAFRNEPFPW